MGCPGLGILVIKEHLWNSGSICEHIIALLIRRVKQSRFLLPKWGTDKSVLCLLRTFKFGVIRCLPWSVCHSDSQSSLVVSLPWGHCSMSSPYFGPKSLIPVKVIDKNSNDALRSHSVPLIQLVSICYVETLGNMLQIQQYKWQSQTRLCPEFPIRFFTY